MEPEDKNNKDNKVALRLTDDELEQLNGLARGFRSSRQVLIRALIVSTKSVNVIDGRYVVTLKEDTEPA